VPEKFTAMGRRDKFVVTVLLLPAVMVTCQAWGSQASAQGRLHIEGTSGLKSVRKRSSVTMLEFFKVSSIDM
jgi:hypothetical protein